jgi:hypothetical protein
MLVPIIMVAGVLGLFAAVTVWMIRQVRKEKEQKRQLAESLGFHPLDQVPTQVSERIRSVRPGKHGRYELRHVAEHTIPDGDCYLFDLASTGGDENRVVEEGTLAVISPGLDLPHFSIYPKVGLPGNFSSLANKALSWITSLSLPAIPMADFPELDRQYFVNSDFEPGLRQILTPDLIDFLIRTPGLVIHASGDTLTVSRMDFKAGRSRLTADTLNASFNTILRLTSLLSRSD